MPWHKGKYIPVTHDRRRKTSMDLGLTVLGVINRNPCEPLSRQIIAYVCNVSVEKVRQEEERGLRKIRRALSPDEWETLNDLFLRDRETARRRRRIAA